MADYEQRQLHQLEEADQENVSFFFLSSLEVCLLSGQTFIHCYSSGIHFNGCNIKS